MVRRRWVAAVIGGIASAMAILTLYNQRAAGQAEEQHPPLGQFVEVEGVRLHYLRKGSGPPVVLLHGNPGSVEDWAAVIAELSATHDVIAFDRPGHGHSDPATNDSGSPLTQAELIHSALSSLGISRPILVGHSWGGGLILAYALRYPDDVGGLVGVEPTSYAEPMNIDPVYSVLATPVIGELVAGMLSATLGRPKVEDKLSIAFSPDPVPKEYLGRAAAMWTRPGEGRATAIDAIRRKEVLAELSPRYPEIRTPLIILAAGEDELDDPRNQAHRLHREVPGSELIAIEHAGHMLPQTRPAEVVAAIRRLSSRTAASDQRFEVGSFVSAKFSTVHSATLSGSAWPPGPVSSTTIAL